MKLHLGCGTVYLEGYVNIDSPLNGCANLAHQRPDLVEKWKTNKNEYYSKQAVLNLSKISSDEFVVDILMDIINIPFPPNSIDEILIVQTFEHFTFTQVDQALKCWYSILKEGCFIDIYVPDIKESIELFLDADTLQKRKDVERLIFGTRKSNLFYHHFGYEKQGLSDMLSNYGFRDIEIKQSEFHDYPSFEIKGWK